MTTAKPAALIVSDVTAVVELPKKDTLTGVEPYVVFKTSSEKVQTKAHKSFEWRDTYVLEKFEPSSSTVLEAEVFDKHTLFPDTNLGSGSVDLATLTASSLDGRSERVVLPLTNKKSMSVGSLSFYLNAGSFRGRSGSAAKSGGATPATTAVAVPAATTTTTGGAQQGTKHSGAKLGRTSSSSSSSSSQEDLSTIQAAGRRGVAAAPHASAASTEGNVMDRNYYSSHEDRAREEALVEKVREHQPFVQQYETTVQPTGRERQVGSQMETLGRKERVLGVQDVTDRSVQEVVNPQLPAGSVKERIGGQGWVQGQPGPEYKVRDFEVAGEHQVDKERVTALREHRDIEKEFEVKTKMTGAELREGETRPELIDRQRVPVVEGQLTGGSGEGHLVGGSREGQPAAGMRSATGTSGQSSTSGNTSTAAHSSSSTHTGSAEAGGPARRAAYNA